MEQYCYSNELLYNIFCFLNRQELEFLCIVSHDFYNLIQKHFSSAPYRFFEQLTTAFEETHYLMVAPSSYICKEFLLKYGSNERGVSRPIADHALNWNESVGSIDLAHVVAIMTPQLLKTIKVGFTSIDIAADKFDEERKNMLRSIAPIWRHDVQHSYAFVVLGRAASPETTLCEICCPALTSSSVIPCNWTSPFVL
uniref:F-box domain-containing protein n=1 Tax=Ditylenchus dipsaci TaxID=166011 RepID=A0A915D9K9_9BILA